MRFLHDVFYANLEDFGLVSEEVESLGFKVKDDKVYIPGGTCFKVINEVGPNLFPEIEVFGQRMEFSSDEPIEITFF